MKNVAITNQKMVSNKKMVSNWKKVHRKNMVKAIGQEYAGDVQTRGTLRREIEENQQIH